MEIRTLFDWLTLLAKATRAMICILACGTLLPVWPAFAQQTASAPANMNRSNRDAQASPQSLTGSAQLSNPGNRTQHSLPNAPSAVQRNSPGVRPEAPGEPFGAHDSAPPGPQLVAGTAGAESAQPESEPLEWHDSHEGCSGPKGFALARHIIEDTVQVGTANYDGGTIVFYLHIPHRPPAPCNATHPH